MVTITLQFANSEAREIEDSLRKKYDESKETGLIALCEKAILRESRSPTYKPFSKQIRECTESGNLVKEKCYSCGYTLLMCKKYGGQCMSSKCVEERNVR